MDKKITKKKNNKVNDFKTKFKLFMEALRDQATAAAYSIHR